MLVAVLIFLPILVRGYVFFDDDLFDFYNISRLFLKQSLLAGHLPFWNPYLFAGQPFLANPGMMAFYPFLYPTLLFPDSCGTNVFYILHLILGAAGMHLWLKGLGLSKPSCWIGSFSFVFSGFFWCEIIHPNILACFSLVPWFFAFLESFLTALSPSTAFWCGLAFAFNFLASGLEITLGVIYAGFLYFLIRAADKIHSGGAILTLRKSKENLKKYFSLPFYFIWGCLPLLALWVPAFEFIKHSGILNEKASYENFNSALSIKPATLSQFLFPVRSIDHINGTTLSYGLFLPNEGFLGIWGPFLALNAFRKKNKSLLIFLTLGILFSISICLGKYTPIHHWICDWLPGFGVFRSPFRFSFIYILCLSALAAMGYEEMAGRREIKPLHRRRALLTGLAYVFIVLGIASSKEGLANPQIIFLMIGFAGLLFWLKDGKQKKMGTWLFFSSILFSLFVGAWTCCSSRLGPASNLNYEKERPLIGILKERVGLGRVFLGGNIPYYIQANDQTEQIDFPTNACCLFGLRNESGFDGLTLSDRGRLHALPFPTFTKLMAIEGFVAGSGKQPAPGFLHYRLGSLDYYESEKSIRFIYAPFKRIVVPNSQGQLDAMLRPSFDPYDQVYLSESPSTEDTSALKNAPSKLEVELTRDDLNEQIFKISLGSPSWLVFSEINYPGWKAWVDQTPCKIMTSDYLFRGIFVPEGKHLVRFRFEPPWFKPINFGFCLWLIGTIIFFCRFKPPLHND